MPDWWAMHGAHVPCFNPPHSTWPTYHPHLLITPTRWATHSTHAAASGVDQNMPGSDRYFDGYSLTLTLTLTLALTLALTLTLTLALALTLTLTLTLTLASTSAAVPGSEPSPAARSERR